MIDLYTVQHTDRNAPKLRAQQDSLYVTSIFKTIQGEGPFAGQPAVFVRLAGCNRGAKFGMGCEFCDTAFYLNMATDMPLSEIISKVRELAHPEIQLVVITGGEPMLQPSMADLARILDSACFIVQIESNGDSLLPEFLEKPRRDRIHLVISPKTTRGEYLKLSSSASSRFRDFTDSTYLKILLDHRDGPYHELPSWLELGVFKQDQVYLSPITVYKRQVEAHEIASLWDPTMIDQELTRKNIHYAAEMAMEYGYHLSLQTHLLMGVH